MRSLVLPLLAAIALAGAALAAPPEPPPADAKLLLKRQPEKGLFSRPDELAVYDSYTVLTRANAPRALEDDFYLLPVPAGELSYVVEELVLRNQHTGDLLDAVNDAKQENALSIAKQRIKLERFGAFRGIGTAVLKFQRARPLYISNTPYEVAKYRIRVAYPKAPERLPIGDSAVDGGAYAELLDTSFVDPEAGRLFWRPLEKSPLAAPTAWQPRPELSPGMAWLKVPVRETGMYAIDGLWLSQAGVDAKGVKPEDLYLVADGKPVPTEITGPAGAGFSAGQRLIFLGVGNESDETAERVYYLGRRPADVAATRFADGPAYDKASAELAAYPRSYAAEQDTKFETKIGSFLSIQKMTWVWGELPLGEPVKFAFDVPGFQRTSPEEKIPARLRLYFRDDALPAKLSVRAKLRGETVAELRVDRFDAELKLDIPARLLDSTQNSLELTLFFPEEAGAPEAPKAVAPVFFDRLELDFDSQVSASRGLHAFQPAPGAPIEPGLRRLRAVGFRTTRLAAFDISDTAAPKRLATAAEQGIGFVQAQVSPASHIIVAEDDMIPRAPEALPSRWVDLAGADASGDVLIIYHRAFEEAANLLAEDHRAAGRAVVLADVDSIYENFSYGALSTESIRAYIARAVYEWKGKRPGTAILVGDCTGDGRGVAKNDVANWIPTHVQSSKSRRLEDRFAADSFYEWLTPGDEAADIIVGRLSASTPEDALAMARNAIAYRKGENTPAEWANQVLSVVDYGDFQDILESVQSTAMSGAMRHQILYSERMPWEDNFYLQPQQITRDADRKVSPLMTAAIADAIDAGKAVTCFFGHGAPNLWSNQRFWFGGGTANSDILRLKNADRLSFVTTFTCNNATIDYPLKPWNVCIAEDFMRHEGKGAIACFMPSGPGYVVHHQILAQGLFYAWTQLGERRLGVLAGAARLNYQVRRAADDHSRMFNFLGDPTLALPPFPETNEQAFEKEEKRIRDGGDLLITDFYEVDSQTTGSLERSWNLVLQNDSSRTKILPLKSSLLGLNNAPIQTSERFIQLAPREIRLERVTLKAPAAGPYTATFEIPHASGAWYREMLPSRMLRRPVFFGAIDSPIDFVEGSARILPARSRRGSPRLEISVANPKEDFQSSTMQATIRQGETELANERRPLARLAAGSVVPVIFNLPTGNALSERLNAEFLLFDEGRGAASQEGKRWVFNIGPEQLPDIAIVPNSLKLSSAVYTDGATVFVEGKVRNAGNALAPSFELALFRSEDEELRTPLRDMTRNGFATVPPMKPNEVRDFQLRWDPEDNAGKYEIALVLDPNGYLLESNRENNRGTVALAVKSKWNLVAGGLRFARKPDSRTVILSAQVGNTGETDAQQVSVTFYRSKTQNASTRVGEVVVPRVEAGTITDVAFEWNPTREEINAEDLAPTFTISLKGSLQRVSSVTASAPGRGPN